MQNYSDAGMPKKIGGATINNTTSASVCFIFPDRLIYNSSNNTQNKQNVVRATAHELGHARGKFLTPEEQAEPYGVIAGLTNYDHTFGHYGNHSDNCIMSYLQGTALQASFEDPHFCEGHLQMLLNTSFH